jgi:hypothetical protein
MLKARWRPLRTKDPGHRLYLAVIAWTFFAAATCTPAHAMARVFGSVSIDYELSGVLAIEVGSSVDRSVATHLEIPGRVVQFPMLLFKSAWTEVRFEIRSFETFIEFRSLGQVGFRPNWQRTTVQRQDTAQSVPLRCQSVTVDGKHSSSDKTGDAVRAGGLGAVIPESANMDSGRTRLSCVGANSFGKLFASGRPFGAEVATEPLSVRLADPGTTLCFLIPGTLGQQAATARICATGHSAKARISYH